MNDAVRETNFHNLKLLNRGKVRDIYEVGGNLLIVATDRISAYDSILGTAIPQKGKVLTALTLFWLDYLSDMTNNHLITAELDEMGPEVSEHADTLRGRAMLVKKAEVLPIECVVRGYLDGSAWREYRESGKVCGIGLPTGLRQGDKLPEPIFSPSTKAESGHDQNITIDRTADIVGEVIAARMKKRSIEIYEKADNYASRKGIIICDTKFEWGLCDGELILIDEVLTPDSSRFWPAETYEPGHPQQSFDKQFVRDWLDKSGWDHTPPGPPLPEDVVAETRRKYLEAYRLLTGNESV